MKISKIVSLCLVGSVAFLVGCGGGGGSSSSTTASTTSTVKTGTFVDAPVAGLEYNTSSGIKGVTDNSGHFQYKKGDKITFVLGSVTFPSVPATNTITPLTITENNTTKAANVAYILQNLNESNNSKIIKLPPKTILKETIKDINLSNETNVTNCIKKIKPIIENKLHIKLHDINVTEAKNQMFSNIDNIIKKLIVGKTYYVPVTDVPNKHVGKLQFQEDGKTLIDTWTENGKSYKDAFDYSIKNGKLYVTGTDIDGKKVNEVFTLKDIQNELYKTYEEAYQHLNDNQNDLKLVKDLVAGKVIFVDENGNQIPVPENVNIRFTPKEYQIDENWSAVNCKIESNGSFGDKCYIDEDMNENNMKNALLSEPVQIVIYKDSNNDFYWEKNEKSYFVEENVTLNTLNNIQIKAKIFSQVENNATISSSNKFTQILSQKGLKPIKYNLSGKTIAGMENDGDELDIVYFNNSSYQYYGYNSDNYNVEDSSNGSYKVVNGIYVGNNGNYFAPVKKNGDVITAAIYYDNNFSTEQFLVLNGNVTNTKITADNVKNLFSDTNFVNVSHSDLEGTWKTYDGEKIVFNNGSFSFTNISNGEGTYTINNGVITLKWSDGSGFSYLLPVEKNSNTLKVYVIDTNSDGILRGGEIHTATKQ